MVYQGTISYAYIQHLAVETRRRVESLDLPYEDEYRSHLQYLGSKEKCLLKLSFVHCPWNIGSARLLAILQEADILTASEYILSIDCADLTQQVMNDLLETEYSLLAHLISFAYKENDRSLALANVLKGCFRSLLTDLKQNPNVIPTNYLASLKEHLQPDELALVKKEHLQLLLANSEEVCSVDKALAEQDHWRDELQCLNGSILDGIISEILLDETNCIDTLQKAFESSAGMSLKYALYILSALSKSVGEGSEKGKQLKDWIKTMFRETIETGLTSKLKGLLLLAREICTANEAILGTYASWYKHTIGEMKYNVTKNQFVRMIEMLTAVLPFEKSLQMLEIHSTTAISAPVKCNQLVLDYKQACRVRIVKLSAPLDHSLNVE
ncbi:uncharacterized protein LOC131206288 [Anopheles bellator]|uniref:uncharacterized protein LOC131206288 n=1 Tax=Anopheles bellator TaxID=139047 RepID=UPI0026471928|nr:uncharacterized protein LOC131206288 [Anopheles bellator]